MSEPSLRDLLNVATEAAFLAGRRTLAYFNTGVAIETKADNTPVTRADREAEQIVRDHIGRYFADHTILGEEDGEQPGRADYRWIVDPIDGTKTFVQGVPLYGTLVGVEVRGEPAVGVVYMPALDEMVAAGRGLGCTWNGRPARVSDVSSPAEAAVMVTNVSAAVARSDAYERLASMTKLQRTWGDCYGYVLVATGRAEVMLDPAMKPWDSAPLLPIVTEAGGHFNTWAGEATIWGGDAVATSAAMHETVMDVLKSEKRRG